MTCVGATFWLGSLVSELSGCGNWVSGLGHIGKEARRRGCDVQTHDECHQHVGSLERLCWRGDWAGPQASLSTPDRLGMGAGLPGKVGPETSLSHVGVRLLVGLSCGLGCAVLEWVAELEWFGSWAGGQLVLLPEQKDVVAQFAFLSFKARRRGSWAGRHG